MVKIIQNPSKKISAWAEEDRPREKLLLKGRAALSDAELLAILIGSGTVENSAVDIAKEMMSAAGNNINSLARQTVKDLMKNKGIGEARAVTIVAAFELGRRRKDIGHEKRRKITSSRDIYDEMVPHLMDLPHEEFWIILLNRANEVVKTVKVSVGGVAGTVADGKLIFKLAIENLASFLILVHNHPSGQLLPSRADKDLTRNLVETGHILGIPVIDHLIFADQGFYSFIDSGDI